MLETIAPGPEAGAVSALQRRVDKLSSLLDVATAMAAERDLNQLLAVILREVRDVVEADRCSLFIIDHERGEIWSKIAQGLEIREIRIPIGVGIAGYVAQTGEKVNLADVYDDPRFDRTWDKKTGYRTKAMLCVPMKNRDGRLTGVIQAINKTRPAGLSTGKTADEVFTAEDEEMLRALGAQASATIENALLNDEIDHLFEGFVKASVYAIESRDPTTSGHSERVAVLTLGIADSVERAGGAGASYRALRFSPAERKEIRYASLLHDFGKVGVREHVLVKANKLFPLEFEMIKQRFEVIKRNAQVEAWKTKFGVVCEHGQRGHEHALQGIDAALQAFLNEADDMLRFITECNRPTVLAEGGFERLHEIKQKVYESFSGEKLPYLGDQELEFLSVRRGSLTLAERGEIESHVVHTYKFLVQIPWTRELKRVPEIAYAHHEKLDGGGYPLKLPGQSIPVQSRMMTISDIYDALTASDRPYKKALPHEKAVDILYDEAKQQKVDKDLLDVFVQAKVHETLKEVKPVPMAALSRLDHKTTPEITTQAQAKVAASSTAPIAGATAKAAIAVATNVAISVQKIGEKAPAPAVKKAKTVAAIARAPRQKTTKKANNAGNKSRRVSKTKRKKGAR
ncbi:MAG: GAF domain-containing protein [Deltaproteobacteria bacterium]|nr:GAF domain-containing protein [Deltaproteobacteria bacterium]